MDITVSVGFTPETLNRIDAFLKAINAEQATNVTSSKVAYEEKVKKIVKDNTPAEAPSTNGKAADITYESLRKLVQEKGSKSKEMKAKVLALIKEYAESVSDIPVESHLEFHNKLTAL